MDLNQLDNLVGYTGRDVQYTPQPEAEGVQVLVSKYYSDLFGGRMDSFTLTPWDSHGSLTTLVPLNFTVVGNFLTTARMVFSDLDNSVSGRTMIANITSILSLLDNSQLSTLYFTGKGFFIWLPDASHESVLSAKNLLQSKGYTAEASYRASSQFSKNTMDQLSGIQTLLLLMSTIFFLITTIIMTIKLNLFGKVLQPIVYSLLAQGYEKKTVKRNFIALGLIIAIVYPIVGLLLSISTTFGLYFFLKTITNIHWGFLWLIPLQFLTIRTITLVLILMIINIITILHMTKSISFDPKSFETIED